MPTEPSDTLRDALYPDDLSGIQGKLTIREWAFYDADNDADAEQLPDDANHGWWLPVELGGDDRFVAAPEALRQDLVSHGAEEGTTFSVEKCERAGPEEHAPYTIAVVYHDD